MSDTVLVSTPGAPRTPTLAAREERDLARAGADVVTRVGHGVVARVVSDRALPLKGRDVVRYPDTHLLELNGQRIDIEKPVRVAGDEAVPAGAEGAWPLHVVQFAGPAFPEWVAAVEDLGVTVLGRAGRYSVYAYGTPDQAGAAAALPFVAFAGALAPGWKLDPRLRGAEGAVEISVAVYPPDELDRVATAAEAAGGTVVRKEAPRPGRHVADARVVVKADASVVTALTKDAAVRQVAWLPPVRVEGEREVQILTESVTAAAPPNTAPVPGYAGYLGQVGASGAGVTVAVVDSGVDLGANNNQAGHVDLRGRQVAFIDYNGVPTDQNGHGTHVTGIAVGNAATGLTEAPAPNDFLWGQGAAPGARFVGQSVADPANPAGSGLQIPGVATLTTDAVTNGATVQNNSWSGGGSPASYTARESDYDELVRDADPDPGAGEPLTIVFAASNDGGLAGTIGDPSSAKNVICVGNSLSARPAQGFPDEDIRGIRGTSSRGPGSGGRIRPDVVAPGTDVSSALSSASALAAIPGTTQYTFMTGTSQAAPHVAGICAVLTEWWRNRTDGRTPSPAMLKALLVNGAEDLVGGSNWRRVFGAAGGGNRFTVTLGFTPTRVVVPNTLLAPVNSTAALVNNSWFFNQATNVLTVQFVSNANSIQIHAQDGVLGNIPDNDQGWGRVSLDNIVFQSPASDRGPRLFLDQRHAFTNNGQAHTWRVRAVDPARPLRVTLAWTDAPGAAGDATPLVNDLDLSVRRLADNAVFRGNPANFAGGFTTAGGVADTANNVECVYLEAPTGTLEVTVRGTTITRNARPPFDATPWQDYALVLENAEFAAADPVSTALLIDRSDSMESYGYVDATRSASKLFVDLLRADDQLAVVTFSDAATDTYAPAGALATITDGSQQAAAKIAIDAMPFDGCTYMGAGLQRAAQLLGSGPGAVVLLSDGYDNKGCASNDPNRPWATDVAADLPAGLDVYTCAMGPASDQEKLEQIAQVTGGKYYYMPTIDDLQEIYNYIRGNVSGDGVIVNQAGTASEARVPAVVDCNAELVTFAVHWRTRGLRWVGRDPKKTDEIQVALRTPSGQAVPANASWVRRVVGDGYVIFTVAEPEAGRWFLEVRTARAEHTPFTAGGWVRAPLQLAWRLPVAPKLNGTFSANAALFGAGPQPLDLKLTAKLTASAFTLPDLLGKHKDLLRTVTPDRKLLADGLSDDVARLFALDSATVKAGRPSLFARATVPVRLTESRTPTLDRDTDAFAVRPLRDAAFAPALSARLAGLPPILQARRDVTFHLARPGSYTLELLASAVNPATGCRFVRKAAQSFFVAPRA